MRHRICVGSRSGPQAGIALVIVLAFIVLISILVVSFVTFARLNESATTSYSKSIQAEEIAQGGIQDVLFDLHREIVSGSTVTTSGSNTIYAPTTNWAAYPARIGYNASYYGRDISPVALPPTLIRVSRASQDATPSDFYPPLNTAVYSTSPIPTNYASAANSSSSSLNGRYVSAARWNKIDLLTTNSTIPPAFATNTPDWVYVTRGGRSVCTTANLTSTTANIKPSNNLTNTAPVTGRYAYAVYDESALIDLNTAGYISASGNSAGYATNIVMPAANNPSALTQNLSSKSYLAYADLTQLPGLSGAQTSVIDPLIQWRNASVSLSSASATTNYFQMVFSNAQTGFTTFHTTGTGTDSPLLNRQDLINYFAKIDPSGTSYSAAVPYLGTFSRAANAPSWIPTADSANLTNYYGFTSPAGYTFTSSNFGNVTYKSSAETSGSVNRDVANVRYSASTPPGTSIVHYNDDGTSSTYSVQPGTPLVQHRFSLARLAWLTYKGPSADLPVTDSLYNAGGTDAAILACFGLQWDAQNLTGTIPHYDRWDYVAATTTNVHILTLDEVAAGCVGTANTGYREPNFFEMLKAGILTGSLGQSPGPADTSNTVMEGPIAAALDSVEVEKNRHILQIGANIIDQFDSDSIPTAIYLALFGVVPPATALTTEADLAFNTVYGDENLPGLTRMAQTFIEDWYDTTNSKGYFKVWLRPELWNIHQVPATGIDMTALGTAGYPHPTQFRVHAYGKAYLQALFSAGAPSATQTAFGSGVFPAIDYDLTSSSYSYHQPLDGTLQTIANSQAPNSTAVTSAIAATSPASLIYFTDSGSAQSTFYTFPSFLQFQSLYPSVGITAFTGTHALNLSNYNPASPVRYNDYNLPADFSGANYNGDAFAALFAGEYPLPDLSGLPAGVSLLENLMDTNPLYFFLECQDPAGHWHPYNYISQLVGYPNLSPSGNLIINDQTTSITANYAGTPGGTTVNDHAVNGITNLGNSGRGGCVVRPDPRTDRFSVARSQTAATGPQVNRTFVVQPGSGATYGVQDNWPRRTWGFVYSPDQGTNPLARASGTGAETWVGSWSLNQSSPANQINTSTKNAFYIDPDGVLRPGDSFRQNMTTGDGCVLYHGTAGGGPTTQASAPSGPYLTTTAIATTPTSRAPTTLTGATSAPTGSAQARRPEILNRPFRTVGELGYAYRDEPFKSLDFSSAESGDAALLDLFSITDEPSVTAGEVNPSNMPIPSLAAILTGANKMDINNPAQTANFMSQAEATSIATALATQLSQGPLSNRADLVKALDPVLTAQVTTTANYGNKSYAEAPVRALANVTNTRTWNLLIDIIAQSGKISPAATSLNDFVVEGERRYWLHIAIDRYTGKIIDQQLEPVYE